VAIFCDISLIRERGLDILLVLIGIAARLYPTAIRQGRQVNP
jgi:hypothetical protein